MKHLPIKGQWVRWNDSAGTNTKNGEVIHAFFIDQNKLSVNLTLCICDQVTGEVFPEEIECLLAEVQLLPTPRAFLRTS